MTPPPTTTARATALRLDRTDRWVLVAILVLGLLLRAAMLGRNDLWSDEVHTLRAMEMPPGGVVGERLGAGHVPLYFLLLRGWTAVFGLSQTAIRLPSALAGTALLVPAFLLFRRLIPAAPSAARWATALVAVHPVFVELSREARMYALVGLVFIVLAEAAVASLDDGRVRVRFWIAAAIGPCVHPSWAFAVAPLAAWVAWERRAASDGDTGSDEASRDARRRAATVVLAGLAASLVLLVALLVAATPQHQVLTRRGWPAEIAVFALRPYLSSRPADWFPTAGLALVAWGAALGAGLLLADRRARAFGVAMTVGVPVTSAASGLIGGVPWGPARYVHLTALGAVVLAAAAGAAAPGTTRDAPAPRAFVRTVGVGARSFVGAALLLLTLMIVGRAETAWSSAAARVREMVPAGETIWVDDESARLVLEHYLASADRGDRVNRTDRTVRVGDDPGGAEVWHARASPGPFGQIVEVWRGTHDR